MEQDTTYATGVGQEGPKLIQYPHYVLVAKVNNARLYPVFDRIQQGQARLRKETAESIT